MSVFFRQCPIDQHTCADRKCLGEPRTEDCPALPYAKSDPKWEYKTNRGWEYKGDDEKDG
jgi:hypothetical protein